MKNFVIGAIHFAPLIGFKEHPGMKKTFELALHDLKAFQKGGVNAVIFENNYDLPHKIKVGAETIASMTELVTLLKPFIKVPFGISVLWNDYEAALSIAKVCSANFVRIPVFVDTVKTDYGIVNGTPEEVVKFKKKIGAENIKLYCDVHVKHAELISNYSLEESILLAEEKGADAIIITGKWTGNAPNIEKLIKARSVAKKPIIIGSGLNKDNVKKLFSYADGGIISTSLKEDSEIKNERNIKPYESRIKEERVREFMKRVKE